MSRTYGLSKITIVTFLSWKYSCIQDSTCRMCSGILEGSKSSLSCINKTLTISSLQYGKDCPEAGPCSFLLGVFHDTWMAFLQWQCAELVVPVELPGPAYIQLCLVSSPLAHLHGTVLFGYQALCHERGAGYTPFCTQAPYKVSPQIIVPSHCRSELEMLNLHSKLSLNISHS